MDQAAGIALYRRRGATVELLLAHLGGPYFVRKDRHGWVVPKGLVEPGESLLEAAKREWTEETGQPAPAGAYVQLPDIKQNSKKLSTLFLVEGDADPSALYANSFRTEWPPRSGKYAEFPEVDRYAWYDLATCEIKLVKSLGVLVERVRVALT